MHANTIHSRHKHKYKIIVFFYSKGIHVYVPQKLHRPMNIIYPHD